MEHHLSSLPLDRLMNPRAIAVVGASERPEAIGTRVIRNLRVMGYPGAIYPVNPRYQKLGDLPCFPSLAALPEPVDAAFLAVPAAQGPGLMEEAAAAGIPAIFTNASGYADGDADGIALQRRLEKTAWCWPGRTISASSMSTTAPRSGRRASSRV
jgi:acyl-CoA synthetase (NDP forming)